MGYNAVSVFRLINSSKNVDLVDFAIVTGDWLVDNWVADPGYCPGKPAGDVTGDCKVDESDMAVLVSEWLDEID